MGPGRPIWIALKPFGMGFQSLFVRRIAIHAGNRANTTPLDGGDHLAEQIARAQKLAAIMIWNLSGIKSNDTSAVQQHRIDFERSPIAAPGVRVHVERI